MGEGRKYITQVSRKIWSPGIYLLMLTRAQDRCVLWINRDNKSSNFKINVDSIPTQEFGDV